MPTSIVESMWNKMPPAEISVVLALILAGRRLQRHLKCKGKRIEFRKSNWWPADMIVYPNTIAQGDLNGIVTKVPSKVHY